MDGLFGVAIHRDFESFRQHALARLQAGDTAWVVAALGRYDDASQRLTARRALLVVR